MKKKHIGSNFDEFLKEQSLLEHSSAVSVTRITAWQIEREVHTGNPAKVSMAKEMNNDSSTTNK